MFHEKPTFDGLFFIPVTADFQTSGFGRAYSGIDGTSFAIIASAWGTPFFLGVVWGVAAMWLVVTIAAFLVLRAQRPGQSFQTLQQELQRDVESVKEAIK